MAKRRLLAALLMLGLGGGAYALAPHAAPAPTAGMVRSTEIQVAPEVSGRLLPLPVKRGDAVRAGAVLATLDNPELAAAVVEARAVAASARAARDRVYAGVRREQVESLNREVQKAQSNLTLAEQQFVRTSALAGNQNASRQQLDQAAADVGAGQAALAAARSHYAEAAAGPTAEDRAIADAQVGAADAAVVTLERRLAKTVLTAPVNGTVRVVVAELGEAVVPGRPILTLETRSERWVGFTLREDRLAGLAIGTTVELAAPDGKPLAARIAEISSLGEFATWRAARAVGDHDLNSFAIRADLAADADAIEPGMTLWFRDGR